MEMGLLCENPWEMSHGMGWDGTARIAFSMNDNECLNDNKL